MARLDPHSYADATQPETESLDWKARVDFAARAPRRRGRRSHFASRRAGGPLDLDTRDLDIEAVVEPTAAAAPLHAARRRADPRRAAARSTLPAGRRARPHPLPHLARRLGAAVARRRRRPPAASTRSSSASARRSTRARWCPLQDTPRVRITLPRRARPCPRRCGRVMAAALRRARARRATRAIERFEMPQPIPPYLLRLRGRRSRRRATSGRARGCGPSRRWSSAAACEFADVETMLAAAEALFGPYDWERFDILTMPPSFPYGGMENPRLTFLTPTLLAGDRSLVNVRRARAGALLDRQPGHQRQRRALLAQRGLHRLRRAAHPRGARGRRRWPRCTPRSAGSVARRGGGALREAARS